MTKKTFNSWDELMEILSEGDWNYIGRMIQYGNQCGNIEIKDKKYMWELVIKEK